MLWASRLPGFLSSEMLVVGAARVLNRVLAKDGSSTLDLRLVGIIHETLLVSALVLFATLFDRRRLLGAVLCVGALLLFGDVVYVSYLNSFYMDTYRASGAFAGSGLCI